MLLWMQCDSLDLRKNLFEERLRSFLMLVYEGTQGWPFIEEGSYRLLIETLLCNQQTCVEDKDDTRRDGVGETSSTATLTTGMTEVGSSCLVAYDSLSCASDDLDSRSQTNDHHQDSAPTINREIGADNKDTNVPTQRFKDQKGISVKSKDDQKPMNNAKENNHKTSMSNVETTIVKNSMIESSKTSEKLPCNRRRRPCHGWISSDDTVDLLYFPPSPLPKHIEKMIGKMEDSHRQRRKSRWDEKPEDDNM
ncbi:uncharacterized protein LOC127118183 isoform X2 [Lathyrus oleraceus]|uniref:uncharacterized protein LOC127118183 isoform X2 n=1 Tax=Pisum sativum TaxID=3888 RepID=UPI0021D2D54A|nr:uncharacterized protein LOC127118183 isoform X2 [Pisum sativum]